MLVQFEKTERGILIQLPDESEANAVFETGNLIDISRENGHFIMRRPDEPHSDAENKSNSVGFPARRSKYTTAELVAKITDENLPDKIDFGPPVGKELL